MSNVTKRGYRSYSFNEGRKIREFLRMLDDGKVKIVSIRSGGFNHEDVTIIHYEEVN